MKKSLLVATLLCTFLCLAQNADVNRQFYDASAAYFKSDREKIHLHPNKSVYLNSETIWFKGYITELKTGLPFAQTTNVHIQLRDRDGKIHFQTLAYAEGSVVTGFIPLGKTVKGGVYQIHAYTNFMNNFAEDESAIAYVSIIDEADGKFYNPAKTGSDIEVAFFPEGGSIVDGISNTVGVRIRDCNGNGIAVKDAAINDGAGNMITTFSTSSSGYGRFDIPAATTQQYTANISNAAKTFSVKLPLASADGVALSANSYTNPQKTVVRLRTNKRGAKSSYRLYVQQGPLASGSAIDLAAGEQTLAIPTADLPYGVNTLFLTDESGILVAHRLFFNPFPDAEPTLDFTTKQERDSTLISGISTLRNGELSISILPAESIAADRIPDMAASTWVNPFLEEPAGEINALVSDYSRKNGYELDNRLICNAPKYTYKNINGTAPGMKHPFDIGLTVKGAINSPIKDRASTKVTMNSFQLGLNETVNVNERNEVIFENIMAVDSTHVHFSLFEKNQKLAKMQMAFSVQNGSRQFVKPFTPRVCKSEQMVDNLALPKVNGAIQLDDVLVTQNARPEEKLANLTRYSNNWARGYKIGDTEQKMYRDVLSFIQSNGFNVEYASGNVMIRSRVAKSFQGSASPLVYMDDVPLSSFNELYGLTLDRIDEIYINRRGYGGGENANNGIIRIYTRRDMGAKATVEKAKSQGFVIEKGFQPYSEFKMPGYDSFNDPGFKQLGAIHWLPRVGTDEAGRFAFKIPNTGLDEVKLVIRGISSQGTPISRTLNVKLK